MSKYLTLPHNPSSLFLLTHKQTIFPPKKASQLMAAASLTSTPWHAIFAFQIPGIGTIVQMHFTNSSPLDEHPASIWIFITCSLLYCFAFGYRIKCQIYTPTDTTSLNRCVKVAFVSGSLVCTALISVLVPRSLQPLVFILCFMLLLIYFNHEKIAEMAEHMASYLLGHWRRTKSGGELKAAMFLQV